MVKNILKACCFYFYNHGIGKFPFYWPRHAYLKHVLKIHLGKNSYVHAGCFITGNRITIGDGTVINRNCYLDGRGPLKIGNGVSISPEVYLLTLTHDVQNVEFSAIAKQVVLEDMVWVGVRAIILPGIVMEKGSIAGAGAVVTKSCAAFSIIAGSPAKEVGKRNPQVNYQNDYHPLFDTDICL